MRLQKKTPSSKFDLYRCFSARRLDHLADVQRRMDAYAAEHRMDVIDTTNLTSEEVAMKIVNWHSFL